jgi:hypothetical protein
MLKNATFLSFYFADNQLFSNSETLVNKRILNEKAAKRLIFLVNLAEKEINIYKLVKIQFHFLKYLMKMRLNLLLNFSNSTLAILKYFINK